MKVRSMILAAALAASATASAYWTPVQVNLAHEAGLPYCAESVYGVRATAFDAACNTVAGVDAGFFNVAMLGVYGLRAGAFNFCGGDVCGITAGIFNKDEDNRGLVVGLFNWVTTGFGVQVGIINTADDFAGLQIGLININKYSDVPIFPIINIGSGPAAEDQQ